nr:hypothetical protein [uncultured Deefgea sp.]
MKSARIQLVVLLTATLAIGFAYSAYQKGYFNQWLSAKPTQIINISCANLSLGCTFKIDQQAFTIKSEGAINTSKPVKLSLVGPAKSVRLSWQMLGMDMGRNYYKMLSDDQQQWRAETMLPICSQQRLDWLLTLDVDQAQVLIQTQSGAQK